MFNYNSKQKSIEGVFRPTNFNNVINNKKLHDQMSFSLNVNQQFLKKLDFTQTKINPFLEMQQQIRNQALMPNDLDYSIIELKSPSYSDLYNSLGNQKFFKALPKQKQKQNQNNLLTYMKEPTFINKNQQIGRKQLYHRAQNQLLSAPTFFIKMPQHFIGQKVQEKKYFRKKIQQQINQQLQDIYKGKYKIEWNPAK